MSGDIKEELPVLFLRLRDAITTHGVRVIEISATDTSLTPLAAASLRHRPGEAHDVVRALVAGGDPAAIIDGDVELAKGFLGGAVTAVVGRASLAESAASVVEAAASLLDAKADTRFLVALRRSNVRGALDMGLAPGLLPGRVDLDGGRQWFAETWATVPSEPGLDATGILQAAADGKIDVLVLLGADPLADFPDHELAKRALSAARTVIAVDTFLNDSSKQAHVVLAAAGYAETTGSTTNIEGRLSLLSQKVTPPGTARQDWMLAAELAYRLGADLGLESVDGIWDEIERVAPAHVGVTRELVRLPIVADGVLVPLREEVKLAAEGTRVKIAGAATQDPIRPEDIAAPVAEGKVIYEGPQVIEPPEPGGQPAPLGWRRPARYETPARDAYSLRLVATRKLYDRGTLVQHAPSLAELAPGTDLLVNPADLERLGVAAGGRVKVSSSRGSVTLEAQVDASLPKGTAHLHVNQPGADPFELIDAAAPVTDIRIEHI
jgi:NADH-quinone oxidoreductase subunit G